ncbi:MAG TPA: sigma-54 dependent transcriptional regulator [Vicinamibacteria bacterium]|nr:sigma-54 dependent transcriptional regulator [Vicinamibacteria bacterium]
MARILVADDEPGIRQFLAEALEDEGHAVTQAADGRQAAEQLRRQGFELLITDLRMPAMDGLELVRLARGEQPEMEIIVLTAHGTVESAVEAMRLGAFDYLQKPIASPAQLRMLAARALERRSLLALRDGSVRAASELPPLGYGDPAMAPVTEALQKVARTHATVLLLGESGTGKELAARSVHAWSARSAGPFVAVSCAAIAEGLLESELFGHEKGAFTGAVATRRGRLELAEGGSVFLDEVAELKVELQAKLLRVLQERQFERVGANRTLEADVRWIAATNRDLEAMVGDGRFREDLYHRLAVFPVRLPPLRERRTDVPPLARALLDRIRRDLGRPGLSLSEEAAAALARAEWPGNVRELANALERAAILADGPQLQAADVLSGRAGAAVAGAAPKALRSGGTLDDLERDAISRALAESNGNRRIAAERLGIGLRTLYDKLNRYGLS